MAVGLNNGGCDMWMPIVALIIIGAVPIIQTEKNPDLRTIGAMLLVMAGTVWGFLMGLKFCDYM